MSFYDIDPNSLPKEAQYYHNVLIVLVGITPQKWDYEEHKEIWSLEEITAPRPTVYCFYSEPELLEQEHDEEEVDFEITIIGHCVVEVCGQEVSWYEGMEPPRDKFDAKDLWRI